MERLVSVKSAFENAQKVAKELPQIERNIPSLTEEDRQKAMEKFQTVSEWADKAAELILDIQDQLSQILKLKGWMFVPSLINKEKSLRNQISRIREVDEESLRILDERIRSRAKEREREKMKTLLSRQNEFLQPEKLKEDDPPTGSYLFHAPYKRREGGRVQLEGIFILRLEQTPKGKVLIPLEGYGCFNWVGKPPSNCFLPLGAALRGWLTSTPTGELGEFLKKLARTVAFFVRGSPSSPNDEKTSSLGEA
jgi:hypothetical protein